MRRRKLTATLPLFQKITSNVPNEHGSLGSDRHNKMPAVVSCCPATRRFSCGSTACETRPVKNYTWQGSGANRLAVCGHSAELHHGSQSNFNRSICRLWQHYPQLLTKWTEKNMAPHVVLPGVPVSPQSLTWTTPHKTRGKTVRLPWKTGFDPGHPW